mgnify:CR=1 FL=1
MSRCVILSACPVQPELKRLLRSDDFIIACDAGYRNCERLGCKPNIIVGDFDSAPCPQQDTDDIVVLPHVKDDTDTEYAAKLAAQKGFDEVLLLGALGGRRVEHTLANLCTGLGWSSAASALPCRTSAPASPLCCRARAAAIPRRSSSTSPPSPWRDAPRACMKKAPSMSRGCRAHSRLSAGREQRICRRIGLHHHQHTAGRACGGGDHRRLNLFPEHFCPSDAIMG